VLATQGPPHWPAGQLGGGWVGHEMGSDASKGIWGWWQLVWEVLAQHSREKKGS
jgi:hypothetical protein